MVTGYACDVGRRVIQCACWRSAAWRGEDVARAQGRHGGWRARPGGELRRVWTCGECWVPPALAITTVTTRLPAYLRVLVASQASEHLSLAQEQIALAGEPPAWLEEIEQLVARLKRSQRAPWEAWLRSRGRARSRSRKTMAASRPEGDRHEPGQRERPVGR